jgi:hypothetical protein
MPPTDRSVTDSDGFRTGDRREYLSDSRGPDPPAFLGISDAGPADREDSESGSQTEGTPQIAANCEYTSSGDESGMDDQAENNMITFPRSEEANVLNLF